MRVNRISLRREIATVDAPATVGVAEWHKSICGRRGIPVVTSGLVPQGSSSIAFLRQGMWPTTNDALRAHRVLTAQRQEVLRALDWLCYLAEEFLQVFVAIDEIDL